MMHKIRSTSNILSSRISDRSIFYGPLFFFPKIHSSLVSASVSYSSSSIQKKVDLTEKTVDWLNKNLQNTEDAFQLIKSLDTETQLHLYRRLHKFEYSEDLFNDVDTNKDGKISYEEFEVWTKKRFSIDSESTVLTPLTPRESSLVAIHTALPMIGFGILDNAIMLTAGDTIEASFGLLFGISTMAAAGLGNLLSDVAGLGVEGPIETATTKLGIPYPNLSNAQWEMPSTWRIVMLFRVIGISIGCLIGMFPLLLMHSEEERFLHNVRKLFDKIDSNNSKTIGVLKVKEMLNNIGLDVTDKQVQEFLDDHSMRCSCSDDNAMNFEDFVAMIKDLQRRSIINKKNLRQEKQHDQ